MTPFLKQVAEHYFTGHDIERECFIFPSRRSLAFFGKYLSEVVADSAMNAAAFGHNGVARPIIMPLMFTVNDFFYALSGVKETDRITQLLCLYDCYKKALPKGAVPDSLDDFIYWGDVLIADFNDVDKYLVRADRIFANISEFRSIDSGLDELEPAQREAIERLVAHFKEGDWSKTTGGAKKDFLRIWNMLYPIYSEFNKALSDNGLSYEGMVYRKLAEMMKAKSASDVLKEHFKETEKYIFVGLNALNECEKTVMKRMRDAGLAEFCWDFSSKIIRDPQNRASKFMRDGNGTGNTEMFPQAFELDPEGLGNPAIDVISVPSSVGQTSQIPLILNEIEERKKDAGNDAGNKDSEIMDCAIVIPDEELLLPLLNTIPPEIEDINITMGYPMSGSSVFALVKLTIAMQLHLRKRSDGQWCFYHRYVRPIFSNEIFRAAVGEEGRIKMDAIRAEAKYYVPQSDFAGQPLMEIVFSPIIKDINTASASQIEDFGKYILDLIKAVSIAYAGMPGAGLELEFARKCYRSINLLMRRTLELLPATYVRLIDRLLSGISVPFNGEPLKGLQIMGPLETRALDFSNIVILSANEGIFPNKNVSSSFIPPEIRKGFGLPTYEYQDRVWAYYFYRMIQRASKVWLVFDSRQEELKSGEESRYIKQLEYIYRERFALEFRRAVAEAKVEERQEPEIVKTMDDIERIKGTRLSASSIEKYLSCPAKFYYSVVKGLDVEKDVAEYMDGGMVGRIFHSLMQALYTGKEAMSPDFDLDLPGAAEKIRQEDCISKDYIDSWLKRPADIRAKIDSLIKREMSSFEISGRDLVTGNLIESYVLNTLKRDSDFLAASDQRSFRIHGLELKREWEFNGYRFIGYIDRLDSVGDMMRVVDYKTGKVLDKEKSIGERKNERQSDDKVLADIESLVEALFSPDTPHAARPKIAFQLFVYDKLVEGIEAAKGKKLHNSIYHVTGLFKEPVRNVPVNEYFIELVQERLTGLLDELSSIEKGFRRTADTEVCKYCDFKDICGR